MQQRMFRSSIAPILALMVCAARPALALWRQANVTANGEYDGQQITVKVTDREQFKQFEVTLTPKPKAVSPFLTGQAQSGCRGQVGGFCASLGEARKRRCDVHVPRDARRCDTIFIRDTRQRVRAGIQQSERLRHGDVG